MEYYQDFKNYPHIFFIDREKDTISIIDENLAYRLVQNRLSTISIDGYIQRMSLKKLKISDLLAADLVSNWEIFDNSVEKLFSQIKDINEIL